MVGQATAMKDKKGVSDGLVPLKALRKFNTSASHVNKREICRPGVTLLAEEGVFCAQCCQVVSKRCWSKVQLSLPNGICHRCEQLSGFSTNDNMTNLLRSQCMSKLYCSACNVEEDLSCFSKIERVKDSVTRRCNRCIQCNKVPLTRCHKCQEKCMAFRFNHSPTICDICFSRQESLCLLCKSAKPCFYFSKENVCNECIYGLSGTVFCCSCFKNKEFPQLVPFSSPFRCLECSGNEVQGQMFGASSYVDRLSNASRPPFYEILSWRDVQKRMGYLEEEQSSEYRKMPYKLKILFAEVCYGKFDLEVLHEAFCGFMEVVFSLNWCSSKILGEKLRAFQAIDRVIHGGQTLPHFDGVKFGRSKERRKNALVYWLLYFKTAAKVFLKNPFSCNMYKILSEYGTWSRKTPVHERCLLRDPLPKVVPQTSYDLGCKYKKNRQDVEGQMQTAAIKVLTGVDNLEAAGEEIGRGIMTSVSDHISNSIYDFFTKWPLYMKSAFLSTVGGLKSNVLDTAATYVSDFYNSVCDGVSSLWASLTGEETSIHLQSILGLMAFFLSAKAFFKVCGLVKDVFKQVILLVLRKSGYGTTLGLIDMLDQLFTEEPRQTATEIPGHSFGVMSLGLVASVVMAILAPRELSSFNTVLNVLGRGSSSVDNFIEEFKTVLDNIYFTVTSGTHLFKSKEKVKEFDDFLQRLYKFNSDPDMAEMVMKDRTKAAELAALVAKCADLRHTLAFLKGPEAGNFLKVYEHLKMVNARCMAIGEAYKKRIESVMVCMTGAPGAGKSSLLDAGPHILHTMLQRRYPEEYPDWSQALVYQRTKGSDYWEGYVGQPYYTNDEILAFTDPRTCATELSEVLNIVSKNAFPLNMAFDQKGKALFRSELFITTTNVKMTELLDAQHKFGIKNPDAVVRRIAFPLRVIRGEEMKFVDGKLINADRCWLYVVDYPKSKVESVFFLGLSRFLGISPARDSLPEGAHYAMFKKAGFMNFRYSEIITAIYKEMCFRKDAHFGGYLSEKLPIPIVNDEDLKKETPQCVEIVSHEEYQILRKDGFEALKRAVQADVPDVEDIKKWEKLKHEVLQEALEKSVEEVMSGKESDSVAELAEAQQEMTSRFTEEELLAESQAFVDSLNAQALKELEEEKTQSMSDVPGHMFQAMKDLWYYGTDDDPLGVTTEKVVGPGGKAVEIVKEAPIAKFDFGLHAYDVSLLYGDKDRPSEAPSMSFYSEQDTPNSWMDYLFRVVQKRDWSDLRSLVRCASKVEFDLTRPIGWTDIREAFGPVLRRYVGDSDQVAVVMLTYDSVYGHFRMSYKEGDYSNDIALPLFISALFVAGRNTRRQYSRLWEKISIISDVHENSPFGMYRNTLNFDYIEGADVPKEFEDKMIQKSKDALKYLQASFQRNKEYWWITIGLGAVGIIAGILAISFGVQSQNNETTLENFVGMHAQSRNDDPYLPKQGIPGIYSQSRNDQNPFLPKGNIPGIYSQSRNDNDPFRPKTSIPAMYDVPGQGFVEDSLGRCRIIGGNIRMLQFVYPFGSVHCYVICSGYKALTVGHIFRAYGTDFEKVMFLSNGPGSQATLAVARRDVHFKFFDELETGIVNNYGYRDLALMTFKPSTFGNPYKDIFRYLEFFERRTPTHKVGRIHRSFQGNKLTEMVVYSDRIECKYNHDIYTAVPDPKVNGGKIRTRCTNTVLVAGMHGEAGMCGLPYVSMDMSSGIAYLKGIHVAGTSGYESYFCPLYREDVNYWVDFDSGRVRYDEPDKDGQCFTGCYIPQIIEDNIVGSGYSEEVPGAFLYGKSKKTFFMPNKSELVPSLFVGDGDYCSVFPIKTAPACLDKDAFRLAREKFFSVDKSKPYPAWVDKVAHHGLELSEGFFPSVTPERPLRRLTLEEAVVSDCDLGLKSLDVHKAAGVWLELQGLSVEDVIQLPVGDRPLYIAPLLRQEVERHFEAVADGLIPRNTCKGCLKDEARDLERVRLKKTRIFCVGDKPHMLWTKMILGDALRFLKQHRYDTTCAIGTNYHGPDWTIIYDIFQQFLDEEECCGGGDFEKYDTSLRCQIAYTMGLHFNILYGYRPGSYDWKLVMAACISVCCPLLIIGNDVYLLDSTNPSGNWMTGCFNSFNNNCVNKAVWMSKQTECRISQCGCGFAMASFARDLKKFFYGDDNVWRVRSAFKKHWNMKEISKMLLKDFSMTYTLPSKEAISDEDNFIPFEKLEFLKRTWRKEGGFIFAPLDEESIHSMLNWVRDTGSSVGNQKQLEQNLGVASMEYSYYGLEAWNSFADKAYEGCRRYNVKTDQIMTFDFHRKRLFETYH